MPEIARIRGSAGCVSFTRNVSSRMGKASDWAERVERLDDLVH
jgi:alkylhydroperoxidase family enzyme